MKGYWIVRVEVKDPEGYKKYLAANAAAFRKYGGRFLVRSGKFESKAGVPRARNVVIEFRDYRHAIAERGQSAELDLIVIEGYDGPQPADA